MFIIVGGAFLLFWGLVDTFGLTEQKSALVTAVVFLVFGLVFEGYTRYNKR